MRKLTVRAIAEFLNAEILGDGTLVITGIAGIKEAKKGDITFLENPKYSSLVESTAASAIIVGKGLAIDGTRPGRSLVLTENPSLAFSRVISFLCPVTVPHPRGIHPTAIIARSAKIGKNAAIGAYTIIGDAAAIGENAIIYGHCFIGDAVSIGKDTLLYPAVTVRERVSIGERVIIHSGAVIGSDGFGFIPVKGKQEKIPQVGTVVLEDDVEIGSNVTVARARFDKTVIGQGTKIDNLVQIAHNVRVGKNCIVIAQAGISGSTVIEDNVIIAGQAGLVGHITVGTGATIAAQAGVTKSVPQGITVSGYPARPHDHAKRINACIQRLPELYKTIGTLEKKVQELERALQQKGNTQ